MIVIMLIMLINIDNENYDVDDHVDDKETALVMEMMVCIDNNMLDDDNSLEI